MHYDQNWHENYCLSLLRGPQRYVLAGGTRVVVERSAPRNIAGGCVVRVAWLADATDAHLRLPDGSVHPAHRAGFEWDEPRCNLREIE